MNQGRVEGEPVSSDDESKQRFKFYINEELWHYLDNRIKELRIELSRGTEINISDFVERFVVELVANPDLAAIFQELEVTIEAGVEKHDTTLFLTPFTNRTLKEKAKEFLKGKRITKNTLVEELIRNIQSGRISIDVFYEDFNPSLSNVQNDCSEISTQSISETPNSSSSSENSTPNADFDTTESSQSDSTSTPVKVARSNGIEVCFSGKNTKFLPAESGVFLATFVFGPNRYRTKSFSFSSNMQLSWNSLLQENQEIARFYETCEKSTYFAWIECNNDYSGTVSIYLQEQWKQEFEDNKIALIPYAAIHQFVANVKFIISRFGYAIFRYPNSHADNLAEVDIGKYILIFILLSVTFGWIVVAFLAVFMPLVSSINIIDFLGIKGLLSQPLDVIASGVVRLILPIAFFQLIRKIFSQGDR
ncbi:MAG TPA: hypothetical protein V6C84_24650 [Coleofasciculaceae cyanobacterium]|jgi:hypothetical protein